MYVSQKKLSSCDSHCVRSFIKRAKLEQPELLLQTCGAEHADFLPLHRTEPPGAPGWRRAFFPDTLILLKCSTLPCLWIYTFKWMTFLIAAVIYFCLKVFMFYRFLNYFDVVTWHQDPGNASHSFMFLMPCMTKYPWSLQLWLLHYHFLICGKSTKIYAAMIKSIPSGVFQIDDLWCQCQCLQ